MANNDTKLKHQIDIEPAYLRKGLLRRIPFRSVCGWMLLGLLSSVIFDVNAGQPLLFWAGLVLGFGLLSLSLIIPCRWIPVPLVMVLVNAPDLTQSAQEIAEHGVIATATPWQFHLGPVSPALLIAGFMALACLRLRPAWQPRDLPLLIHLTILVPTVALINGYAFQSPSWFLTDAKLAIYFSLGLVLFSRYYALYPRELLVCCQIFLAIAAGRYALDAFYLFAGVYKTVISGFNRVSLDSTKGILVVFIFLFGVRLMLRRGRLGTLVLLPVSLYLLLAYQTRWLVLTLAAGGILVVLSVGPRAVARGVGIVVTLGFVAVPFLATLRPHVLEVVAMRFSSFGLLQDEFDLKLVDSTRVGSVVNSVSLLHERGALLTGLGYGSWYSDDFYPFSNLTEGDFDQDSLNSRRFYRVHDFGFHMLFKVGLIGVVLYIGAFAWPLFGLWRVRARLALDRDRMGMTVFLVLMGIAPTVISSLFWSAKGLVLSGAYLATVRAWKTELTARSREDAFVPVGVGRVNGGSDDPNDASHDIVSVRP